MASCIQQTLYIETLGRGTYEITERVNQVVSPIKGQGLCHVFITHTSASLLVTENADPDVRRDLETFFSDLVPDGDPRMRHDAEGPDDMPAHIRAALTQTNLAIPLADGKLLLGTWQGIYLWEHRTRPHSRRVIVSVQAADNPG